MDGGQITAVGSVPEEPGDQIVRVDGDIITAGLINTHHHFYQWMTRGWAFDCTLFGWLTTLYPVWARLTPEDVEAASAVALGELALSGCTTAADHHYVVPGGDDSVFDAIAQVGPSDRHPGIHRARLDGPRAEQGRAAAGLGGGGTRRDSRLDPVGVRAVARRRADHDHGRAVQPVQRHSRS